MLRSWWQESRKEIAIISTDDIVALYQLAQTADIKVGQAPAVAALMGRIEELIAALSVQQHLAARAQQAKPAPVPADISSPQPPG